MDIRQVMDDRKVCVVVPTYNNGRTIVNVLRRIAAIAPHIMVVVDGCTDDTREQLNQLADIPLTVVDYTPNKGKGHALLAGFEKAKSMGYKYALTIDSDGQHFPEDIPQFIEAMQEHPGALIVGARNLQEKNMPGGNTFANKFSNFWFMVQTGINLPDTQTGYRLYPLRKLSGTRFVTSRYEAELELLVFAAWSGVELVSVPVRVYYPPQGERVSHFRPTADFSRISVLNTILCVVAVFYGWPRMLYQKMRRPLIRWLTEKDGQKRPVPITFKRIAYSLFALLFFLSCMYLFVLPYTWLYFHLGKATEKRKLRYHKMLRWMSDFVIHHVPGVKFHLDNSVQEAFERPAVVISNHQSHLDLMCLMMLTPRIIFLTNDWVWNNPFYGMVIHKAEFYPVSDGIEHHVERLRALYERGYSIAVFPEGTRSEDCCILRFHKGAFYLAEQLKADILPIYLHGVGHVLPKRDFMLREGSIDVEVGERIPLDDKRFSSDLLERTRQMRHFYQEHYQQMCQRLETEKYWAPYRKYAKMYGGRDDE
jgi:1-acyl-sn-glycerol-3-phosphate acyltransferase